MSSKIKEKDRELLLTDKQFDYSSLENRYFGGYFGEDSEDYVEALIHDVNDNLLETAIVDDDDYYYDEQKQGIKLNTGTILRKLGYDRGRFKVIFNFLRKVAGSYQTLVVDDNGLIFNGEVQPSEIDNTLFIKENKYLIHQISPSRSELRLIPQNIRDENYVRNFYNLAQRNKKIIADGTPSSAIEFVGNSLDEKRKSRQIRFKSIEGEEQAVFEPSMVGGKISIPNFFLTDIIEPPAIVEVGDQNTQEVEIINSEVFQASFFLDKTAGNFSEQKNKGNYRQFGNPFFPAAYRRFRDIAIDETIPSNQRSSVDFEGSGRTPNDVWNLGDTAFNVVYLDYDSPRPTIDIVSNSYIRGDFTIEYQWEVTGFDNDDGDKDRITVRAQGADSGGNVRIVTPDPNLYATVTPESGKKAIQTIQAGDSTTTRQGSRLRLELFGKDLHIGIKLTINEDIGQDSSTVHLPAIIETN